MAAERDQRYFLEVQGALGLNRSVYFFCEGVVSKAGVGHSGVVKLLELEAGKAECFNASVNGEREVGARLAAGFDSLIAAV